MLYVRLRIDLSPAVQPERAHCFLRCCPARPERGCRGLPPKSRCPLRSAGCASCASAGPRWLSLRYNCHCSTAPLLTSGAAGGSMSTAGLPNLPNRGPYVWLPDWGAKQGGIRPGSRPDWGSRPGSRPGSDQVNAVPPVFHVSTCPWLSVSGLPLGVSPTQGRQGRANGARSVRACGQSSQCSAAQPPSKLHHVDML